MTEMTELRELFLHELCDILYAERVLVKTLSKLEKEASDSELAGAFKSHQAETEQHVSNIEQAFEVLDEKAKAEKCPAIDGIKQEHDDFVKDESPSPEILNSFLTGAGSRAEHYEIAAYEGLITTAEALGEEKVADLLKANLADEKEALTTLKTISKRLARVSAKEAVEA